MHRKSVPFFNVDDLQSFNGSLVWVEKNPNKTNKKQPTEIPKYIPS